MAWCRQTTSHYLSQCWYRFMSPHGITRPQWIKLDPPNSKLFTNHIHWNSDNGPHLIWGPHFRDLSKLVENCDFCVHTQMENNSRNIKKLVMFSLFHTIRDKHDKNTVIIVNTKNVHFHIKNWSCLCVCHYLNHYLSKHFHIITAANALLARGPFHLHGLT